MSREQQKQGQAFERRVSTALNDLRREGKLCMVHKFVNCVGTPSDFLVLDPSTTYLIECKYLIEGKAGNKGYSLRLSCITDNEWAGMRAAMGPNRQYWVVWAVKMLNGEEYVYAAPGWMLLPTKESRVKHLRVDVSWVKVVGADGGLQYIERIFKGL